MDATFLAQHPDMNILIEGYCDDRGSEENNLALGDNRATTLKNSLLASGVSADRVKTVSYGNERPFWSQDNEQWQYRITRFGVRLNRLLSRDLHIVIPGDRSAPAAACRSNPHKPTSTRCRNRWRRFRPRGGRCRWPSLRQTASGLQPRWLAH